MSRPITLDAEFLRRALGHGQQSDLENVEVTPGALPPMFR